jgi:replicative superfamily II helicase
MNDIIFDNMVRILQMGKQMIIFAHKRAETYTTAMELIEILKSRPKFLELFNCESKH